MVYLMWWQTKKLLIISLKEFLINVIYKIFVKI